ncbi:MAG: exonuclease domain-containing protein, partial [Fibrobacter sp.]|nr:exonuclease domain-containing protein [Fibrobacter sp.]
MPKLFDLIPENSKKELLEEARKSVKAGAKKTKNRPVVRKHTEKSFIKVPDFVALDVETTGLDFKRDRIIEIGAIRYINGAFEEEFSTFINAGVDIPQHITDLTGINNSQIAFAPSFGDIADKLLEFIGDKPLCGHQIEFDQTFLNEELKRISKPLLTVQLLDTALLSRILLQHIPRFSLKAVSEYLDVTLNNAHRALHDAKASGEVAVHLVPKLAELPEHIRQTMAACSPGSLFKKLVLDSLGHLRPSVKIGVQNSGKQFGKFLVPDKYTPLEKEFINEIFDDNGLLKKKFEQFKPRESQKKMAQEITDTFNTQSIFIAEAGTGIGKTLAYLIPSAFWAIKNRCRVLVSTRTRNLQDQLVSKDLPLVEKLSDNKLKYSVLKGRSNYICINRWRKLLCGEIGNISPRERFAILPLIPWVESTETGDIEEQNQFNPKWFGKIWNLISAESHQCAARKCPDFTNCFFQRARMKASGSHIVVINHALFFSDVCSENSILGKTGSILFDEAHHLESCGHTYLRVEFDTNRINLFLDTINNLVLHAGEYKNEEAIYQNGKELRASLKRFRKKTQLLLAELDNWAYGKLGTDEYQMAYKENTIDSLHEVSSFELSLNEITDWVYSLKQAIVGHPDAENFEMLEAEAQSCYERSSQLKADFLYLTAAKTENDVFWIEGNHAKNWTKLCGVPLDIGTFLSDIWEKCNGAVIFTSATLSVSDSFEYFKRAVGLGSAHEERTV